MLFNLFNLLTAEGTENNKQGGTDPWVSYLMLGGAVLIIVVLMVLSRRSQKKKQEETNAMLDALAPGNKVKTIGGICGIVVEVCKEDNTFILETGSEESGKSYIKFDKQAIYQTDAKAPVAGPVESETEEESTEETAPEGDVFPETAPEAPVETPAEAPVDAPVTENTEEKAE